MAHDTQLYQRLYMWSSIASRVEEIKEASSLNPQAAAHSLPTFAILSQLAQVSLVLVSDSGEMI
ncbi:hypothetical protein FRC01_013665, partial [Tulasnella sp. 417]